jgi:hypothetical protein
VTIASPARAMRGAMHNCLCRIFLAFPICGPSGKAGCVTCRTGSYSPQLSRFQDVTGPLVHRSDSCSYVSYWTIPTPQRPVPTGLRTCGSDRCVDNYLAWTYKYTYWPARLRLMI